MKNGISTEISEEKILFKFVLPPVSKDINMLKDISIFKEIIVVSKQIKTRKEK